ncbi:MAG: RluA family pseudouridine synthase [Endomicrobium sp.]|jgi:23S rRNA pseudouridine1911/1915/1917 synthase|nr:RluA family pseudouridine synthase [Endomicrobium sp.]
MQEQEEKVTYEKFERERVDSYLASIYTEYSRSYFQKLTDKQKVFVNNKHVLASYKLKKGDIVSFEFDNEKKLQIEPEKIKLDIIYEDDDIILVNKQHGIVVHPSYGHPKGTLLNALMARSKGKYNPYLVHRLDKDTSGLIIFAKNEKSKISISKQLYKRAVKKIYLAIVKWTIVENKGIIKAPLSRSPQNRKLMSVNPLAKKMAISEFKVLARRDGYTLVEVRIITGRTHQIRSHMKYINHPVVGDQQYGGSEVSIDGEKYNRQMLHAYHVTFTHPRTSRTVEFEAELPNDMRKIFKNIELKS